MKNLAAQVFIVLRDMFFDKAGSPRKFDLRENGILRMILLTNTSPLLWMKSLRIWAYVVSDLRDR